jgi:uncharacterized protein (TIGR02679 family)
LDKAPSARLAQRAGAGDLDFTVNMTLALRALANLPDDYQRLPLFVTQIGGDPHSLDPDRAAEKLFLEGLRIIRVSRGDPEEELSGSAVENINELLYGVKLLRDDLLNFVTCYGLAAFGETGEITYWREAVTVGAPLNIPLRELIRVTTLRPVGQDAENVTGDGKDFSVFVVENSGVFSALLDHVTVRRQPLVCLHGQFRLASWALLDRLTAGGAVLHYSGDLDPEGLQMAQKLLLRYPGQAVTWRMSVADYLRAGPAVPPAKTRLQKLASLQTPQLTPLAEALAAKGLAAYQEGIVTELTADLLRISAVFQERF